MNRKLQAVLSPGENDSFGVFRYKDFIKIAAKRAGIGWGRRGKRRSVSCCSPASQMKADLALLPIPVQIFCLLTLFNRSASKKEDLVIGVTPFCPLCLLRSDDGEFAPFSGLH